MLLRTAAGHVLWGIIRAYSTVANIHRASRREIRDGEATDVLFVTDHRFPYVTEAVCKRGFPGYTATQKILRDLCDLCVVRLCRHTQ